MTKFTLTIDTDNAAFEDDPSQLGDILRDIGRKVDQGFTSEPHVLDGNGNTVGSWEIK